MRIIAALESSAKGKPVIAACVGLSAHACGYLLSLEGFLKVIADCISILSGAVGFIWMCCRFYRWLKTPKG